MPLHDFVILFSLLAVGYAVMLFRLWRRLGTPRVFNPLPRSRRGWMRVLILVFLFGFTVLIYFARG